MTAIEATQTDPVSTLFRLGQKFAPSALIAVLVGGEFLRLVGQVQRVDPPLLEGALLLARLALGTWVAAAYLLDSTRRPTAFNAILILLLLILAVIPLVAVAFWASDVAFMLPYYLMSAADNAFYVAVGYFLAKQGAPRAFVIGLFVVMTVSVLPFLFEMLRLGFGSATALSRTGLHITLGDHYTFASLLLLGTLRQGAARFAIVGLTTVFLLALGSRTSLYTYLGIIPVMVAWAYVRGQVTITTALAIVGGTFLFGFLSDPLTIQRFGGLRMFSFLSTGYDSSWNARIVLNNVGWRTIMENPVFGDFGSDIRDFGGPGFFIHSYLEMWRQFGLVPFLIFCGLVLMATGRVLKEFFAPAGSLFLVLFAAICLQQIVASRSYGYPQVFAVLGYCAWLAARRSQIGPTFQPAMINQFRPLRPNR